MSYPEGQCKFFSNILMVMECYVFSTFAIQMLSCVLHVDGNGMLIFVQYVLASMFCCVFQYVCEVCVFLMVL